MQDETGRHADRMMLQCSDRSYQSTPYAITVLFLLRRPEDIPAIGICSGMRTRPLMPRQVAALVVPGRLERLVSAASTASVGAQ
jgi:hypothetical protein